MGGGVSPEEALSSVRRVTATALLWMLASLVAASANRRAITAAVSGKRCGWQTDALRGPNDDDCRGFVGLNQFDGQYVG